MELTIFTPTYNRAYILPKLYESLKQQTCLNFEWIVVDDGSTDDTCKLVSNWVESSPFEIRFFKKENGGKHRAINLGVSEAKGDWFFIVDSDDFLIPTAVEIVSDYIGKVSDNQLIAGISGMRAYPNGARIGGDVSFNDLVCSFFDFHYKYGVNGDLAEVYRTTILKKFPFPDVEGEKFCPETLVWSRIAQQYQMLFFNKKIYICDYLDDGLSMSSLKHRINSPQYAMMTYNLLYSCKISAFARFKAAISFWRFYYHGKRKKLTGMTVPFIFKPLGFLIYKKDRITL